MLRDFEQAVAAIGHVEHPEHGHLVRRGVRAPSDGVIEAALAELRLTLQVLTDIGAVAFEHLEYCQTRGERARQLCRLDEVHVVRGGVILRKASMWSPRQPPDREVETRRAKLSLVVAVRRELLHF